MSSAASEPAVGSAAATRVLEKLVLAPDGAQVVLFYGEKGGDASALADLLVKSWLCPVEKNVGGCGKCPVCRAAAVGRAVDFQKMEPFGAGRQFRLFQVHETEPKDEDAKKWEGIPILQYFRSRPLMARAKVVWLDPADRILREAANSVLKILEELPPYARVVMTTDDLGRVTPTIRSRSLCVACDLPADLEQIVGPMNEVEKSFARTAGDVDKIRAAPSAYAEIHVVFQKTLTAPVGMAPALAEEARSIAANLSDATGGGARAGQLEALGLLAAWWTRHRPDDPGNTAAIIEAHRLVQGNVGAGAVFDMVFARLLV